MIKFEPVNTNPTTIQKVFLNSIHVGNLVFNNDDQTFVYESIGGNRTILFQKKKSYSQNQLLRESSKSNAVGSMKPINMNKYIMGAEIDVTP